MNRNEVRNFVQEVHVGDKINVDYEKGFFRKRVVNRLGYVATVGVYGIELADSDPIDNPPITIFGTRQIAYDSITGYRKLANPTFSPPSP